MKNFTTDTDMKAIYMLATAALISTVDASAQKGAGIDYKNMNTEVLNNRTTDVINNHAG